MLHALLALKVWKGAKNVQTSKQIRISLQFYYKGITFRNAILAADLNLFTFLNNFRVFLDFQRKQLVEYKRAKMKFHIFSLEFVFSKLALFWQVLLLQTW